MEKLGQVDVPTKGDAENDIKRGCKFWPATTARTIRFWFFRQGGWVAGGKGFIVKRGERNKVRGKWRWVINGNRDYDDEPMAMHNNWWGDLSQGACKGG